MKQIAKIALFLAIFSPLVVSADSYMDKLYITPGGVVIDWYGNVISPSLKTLPRISIQSKATTTPKCVSRFCRVLK